MIPNVLEEGREIKIQVVGKKPGRYAFIIGAMKSGTTSLFEILGQHPQICSSEIKESDYFVEERDQNSLNDYLALWDWKEDKHSIALESSVAYTKAPHISGVPKRIHNASLGDYRFIYMLREPLSRIESHVRHGLFAGWGQSLDMGIPEDAVNFSRYAMQLDKYLEFFPRKNFMLITLEEFKINPRAILDEICEFLEIEKNIEFNDVDQARNSGNFFNAPPSIARLTQGSFGQGIASRILPAKTKSWLRGLIASFSESNEKTSSHGRWQLKAEERDLVLAALAEDLIRLEHDIGIDVHKYWRIDPSHSD